MTQTLAMPQMPSNYAAPSVESLMNMSSSLTSPAYSMQGIGSAVGGGARPAAMNLPSYQVGGMIGPGGNPAAPMGGAAGMMPMPGNQPMMDGGAPQAGAGLTAPGAGRMAALTPSQIMMEAQKFVQQRPREVQQIQAAIQQALQSGTVSMQQLNMIVQMAMVALQNPNMYPQLRKLAIQQGLASEQDISPQYDPGLLFTLVVVGQTLQAGGAGPNAGGTPPMPSMKNGGPVPSGKTPTSNDDEAVIIRAHEGEYVIPKHVVRAKGVEFFDSLVKKYAEAQNGSED